MSDLPAHVVEEDRRLERTASSASEELARLRWHWTLDESNTERVSISEYARAVGRSRATIGEYAKGYAEARRRNIPTAEAMKRAAMSAEREAATEAVAEARGLSFGTARQNRPAEVKRVLDTARERAERYGTTVADEAAKVADWTVRAEKAAKRVQDERRERLGLRFIELEELLHRARRELVQAVNLAAAMEWGDDERELLEQTVANVRALLELINVALVGTADVDWDAELASLEADLR